MDSVNRLDWGNGTESVNCTERLRYETFAVRKSVTGTELLRYGMSFVTSTEFA